MVEEEEEEEEEERCEVTALGKKGERGVRSEGIAARFWFESIAFNIESGGDKRRAVGC